MSARRILLVDDEPHILRIMKMALDKAGYAVDVASDGLQALEKIQQCEPDLMISDIDMPRMNGRELCCRIGEEMPDRNFGIFILTARAEDEHRFWSRSMGNLDFLEKPVSIKRLLDRLEKYFLDNRPDGDQECQSIR